MGNASGRNNRRPSNRCRRQLNVIKACLGIVTFAMIVVLCQASWKEVLGLLVDLIKVELFYLVSQFAASWNIKTFERLLLKALANISRSTLRIASRLHKVKHPKVAVPKLIHFAPSLADSDQKTGIVAPPPTAQTENREIG